MWAVWAALAAGTLFSSTSDGCKKPPNLFWSPGASGGDTDEDGWTDGQELSAGTDIFDAQDHPH